MIAFEWLKELNEACFGLFSTEKPRQKASNAELKRWFDKGSVVINGERLRAFDEVANIKTIILFPKSDKQRRSYIFNT